jgi:hypothetical protein
MASEIEAEEQLSQCKTVASGPSREILPSHAIVLADLKVYAEDNSSIPLYSLSHSIFAIPQATSSIQFERVEGAFSQARSSVSVKEGGEQLFYMVHPENAQYRMDTPGYYLTSVSAEMMGNIILDKTESKLQKSEFKALLSPGTNCKNNPLFSEHASQVLFTAKASWKSGRYKWTDSLGQEVASEDTKELKYGLDIKLSLERHMRDALVALWILRLWHDVAESREAKTAGGFHIT